MELNITGIQFRKIREKLGIKRLELAQLFGKKGVFPVGTAQGIYRIEQNRAVLKARYISILKEFCIINFINGGNIYEQVVESILHR